MKKRAFKFGLASQIILGLILGIIIGAVFYGNSSVEKFLTPIGDIFIRMIKMIVIPIVVSSLVIGVAGVGDVKKVGKLGAKTILYFEIITTVALIVGLLMANWFQPGSGIDMHALHKTNITKIAETTEKVEQHGPFDLFVNIVPSNVFESLAQTDMLAIIFFSVLFGLGISAIGEKGRPVLQFFEGIASAMFWITNLIMKFAPFGVFAFMGVTVAKFGLESLIPLSKLVGLVYLSMIFFIVVVLGITARIVGVNLFHIVRILKDELILSYTTASSETVLPNLMHKMERFGCSKGVTSFVIPTGYSFNLDGSTLYQAIAAIFIAQVYGIHMSIGDQITLLITLMITSKGIAGVPGVSFVVLSTTLGAMGLPIEGLAFIAGVDRIMDMARTAVNVVGNSLAAVVMSKWENQYDEKQGKEYLREVQEAS